MKKKVMSLVLIGVIAFVGVLMVGSLNSENVHGTTGAYFDYQPDRYATTTATMQLRSGVGFDTSSLGTVPRGSEITIYGYHSTDEENWYHISYNGKEGYVSSKYAKIKYFNYEPDRYATTTTTMELRNGIGFNMGSLGTIPSGSSITVYGYYSVAGYDWYKVGYGGKVGYVSSAYVKLKYFNYDPDRYATTTTTMHLRKGIGFNMGSLGSIPKNSSITVYGTYSVAGSDWYKIGYKGKVGYVSSAYVKLKYFNYSPDRYASTTTKMELRNGIGFNMSSLGTIPKDSFITIYGTYDVAGYNWYKIGYEGKIGYVSSKYAKLLYINTADRWETTSSAMYLRSSIGFNTSGIKYIPKGAKIKKYGNCSVVGDDWYKVYYGGKVGYVSSKYVNTKPTYDTADELSRKTYTLINQYRAAFNLNPLTYSQKISDVAEVKSQDMVDNEYFDHNSPNLGSPDEMLNNYDIEWISMGENLALFQIWGSSQSVNNYTENPESAMDGLIDSVGHREAIIDPDFNKVGVGFAEGYWYDNSGYSKVGIWTQLFVLQY